MRFFGAGGKMGFGRGSSLSETFYIGGNFQSASYEDDIGFIVSNRIAKWNGTQWISGFGSGMNNIVRTLVFDSSGNLYAGGNFTTANGVTVNYIAKWNVTQWSG